MTQIFNVIRELDPFYTCLIGIFCAMLFGGIIGTERGRQGRAAGLRTHILVCLGATLTAMTGLFVFEYLGNGDPLRVAAQVISGIGFLGVGTILIKGRFQITGLTTAAGLWTVAAIGIALGLEFYEGAILVFLAAVLTTTILHRLECKFMRNSRFGIYVEIASDNDVKRVLAYISKAFPTDDLQVTPPRSGKAGNVGIEANILAYKKHGLTSLAVIENLQALDGVIFAIESV